MIRSILLAGAMALAVPAFAQNKTNDDMNKPVATEGVAAPDAQDRAAPNMAPGVTPTSEADEMSEPGMAQDTKMGTSMGDKGNMNAPQSNNGSMNSSAGRAAPGYTGMGGPAEGRDYPMCSRTVTDSCMQAPGRRSRPRR